MKDLVWKLLKVVSAQNFFNLALIFVTFFSRLVILFSSVLSRISSKNKKEKQEPQLIKVGDIPEDEPKPTATVII